MGSLKGWRLSVALPYIRKLSSSLLRVRAFNFSTETHTLPEEDGVRLALTFIGIRNLRKLDRAEKLAREIHAMGQEESYYWYAKALTARDGATGIKALRTLFGKV